MSLPEKLLAIQSELKAPKNQRNTFGGYNYRSCEDILEAVKPLCLKHKCVLTISDDIVEVGGRVYVKATAILSDIEEQIEIENTAFAREPAEKKAADASQITGAASSYARKYALNGLFCIDDQKDADTNEYRNASQNAQNAPVQPQATIICKMCGKEIPAAQRGGKTLTAAVIAQQTGGMCISCFKGTQK